MCSQRSRTLRLDGAACAATAASVVLAQPPAKMTPKHAASQVTSVGTSSFETKPRANAPSGSIFAQTFEPEPWACGGGGGGAGGGAGGAILSTSLVNAM